MRILYLALTLLLATPALFACTELTIEEKRLAEAAEQLPEVVSRYDETVETFKTRTQKQPRL